MMRGIILAVLLLAMSVSCTNSTDKSKAVEEETIEGGVKISDTENLVAAIESAHQKSMFNSYQAIQFEFNLNFGGKERFNGRLYMLIDGSKIKMEDASTVKYWDGSKAMVLPSKENNEKARFDLLTWSYFFSAPYKLNDPGTNHEYLGEIPLGDSKFEANKLTFDKGVGDTPDDWYIIYKDKSSDLLAAMAYIVTSGGTDVEEAEKDPHLITYEAYDVVNGVPFATQWNFWTWTKEGEMKKLLGSATISNIQFIKKAGDIFDLTAS